MKIRQNLSKSAAQLLLIISVTLALFALPPTHWNPAIGLAAGLESKLPQETVCGLADQHVATPLIDLGNSEYIRMDGQHTGYPGGLYPGGSNVRPAGHEAAGIAIANQIQPLDGNGNPDPNTGKIVMISVGMSNASQEFIDFKTAARADPNLNPHVVIVNGAQPMMTAESWQDPAAATWQLVNTRLASNNVTPQQVQTAWVKQTRLLVPSDPTSGDFPKFAQDLQENLITITHNLKNLYPNIKIIYFSSRTRSYTTWHGLNPEPIAFETGLAVKWLIEQQINGAADLNYDPAKGPVTAPYLTWSAYLWADGENPRSDGLVWLGQDMVQDCVHPASSGRQKVVNLLMDFFKTDPTAHWLWVTRTAPSNPVYLPVLMR